MTSPDGEVWFEGTLVTVPATHHTQTLLHRPVLRGVSSALSLSPADCTNATLHASGSAASRLPSPLPLCSPPDQTRHDRPSRPLGLTPSTRESAVHPKSSSSSSRSTTRRDTASLPTTMSRRRNNNNNNNGDVRGPTSALTSFLKVSERERHREGEPALDRVIGRVHPPNTD